jgi:hypothetical protein
MSGNGAKRLGAGGAGVAAGVDVPSVAAGAFLRLERAVVLRLWEEPGRVKCTVLGRKLGAFC